MERSSKMDSQKAVEEMGAKLSVILPAYNEEKMIRKAQESLQEVLGEAGIPHEIVFVDDGSTDGTWEAICRICEESGESAGVHFSRNFGKEAAIFAGLAHADGAVVAVMDCDLQHPPETLVEMYRLWEQGYEIVEGVKAARGKESLAHKCSAGFFYKIMSKITGMDMQNASDFKMMDRKVVEALLALPERNTFFRALSSWVGYKTVIVKFEVREREEGVSKWSTKALIKYAMSNIAGFTSFPLQIVAFGGFAVLAVTIVLGLHTLVKYFSGRSVEGFPTVILLILFIGSVIMISLGIIGYYLSKIYDEIKQRPRYIISEIAKKKD